MSIEPPNASRSQTAKLARKRALIRSLIEQSRLSSGDSEVPAVAGPDRATVAAIESLVGPDHIIRINPESSAAQKLAEIIPFPAQR